MGQPIAPAKGIAFAFPDVCLTPASSSSIPIPYPNIAQLKDAKPVTDEAGKELLVGSSGDHVLLQDSIIDKSTGDEAGSDKGVGSLKVQGECVMSVASSSVLYGSDGRGIVRFMDMTEQNDGNAAGNVMSAFPTVLAGG